MLKIKKGTRSKKQAIVTMGEKRMLASIATPQIKATFPMNLFIFLAFSLEIL